MDFSKFLSSDFDAKAWINAALTNADSSNVEQSSNTLILKLQMSMQEVSNTIEEQCTSVTQQLPRLLREMDTVKQEALLLQHQMNEVRREVELCEQNTANSMRSIVAVDRLKSRMQSARKALEDADNWQLLSNELEDLFSVALKQTGTGKFDIDLNASLGHVEGGNVHTQIIGKLTKMRLALNALAHVANYAERAAYFDTLAKRFEALVRDELRAVIAQRDGNVCARWYGAFARLERATFFRTLFLETECDTLLRRIGAIWNEIRAQDSSKQTTAEGESASDTLNKRTTMLSRFIETVLGTLERDGYAQHFSFVVTVFGDEAALLEVDLIERCVANALLSSSDALFVRTLRSISESARSTHRSMEYLDTLVAAKRQFDAFANELRAFLTANSRLASAASDDSNSVVSTFRTRFMQFECVGVSLLFAYDTRSRQFLDVLEELLAAAFADRIEALAVECAQRTTASGSIDELGAFVEWFGTLARADWFAFARRLFSATLALGDAYAVPRFFSQLAAAWPKLLDELARLTTNRFDKHRSRFLPFLARGSSASLGDAEYQATLNAFASSLQVGAAFGEMLIELFRFAAFCAHILTERGVPRRIQADEFQCVTASSSATDSASRTLGRSTRAFAFGSVDEKQTCVAFLKKLLRNYASVSGETDMLNLVSIESRPKTIRSMRTALQERAVTFQNSVAFDLPANVVRRSLAALPAAVRDAERSQSTLVGELPLFSFAPSVCVTQLGEFLMLVPQTLDLHTSSSLCISNECREPHLVVLVNFASELPFRVESSSRFEEDMAGTIPQTRHDSGSRTRLESGSQVPVSPKGGPRERTMSTRERHPSVTDYSPASSSAALHQLAIQFVNGWLEAVVRFALARACDELFENVRTLSERSTKQLLVDINYLLNVADDLGVQRVAEADGEQKRERIDTVQKALQLSVTELAESERSCDDDETRNVFATILKMRNASAATSATASVAPTLR